MSETERIRQLLHELTALEGISGFEGDVARYMAERFRPLADRVTVDDFGNVIAERRGGDGPSLMVAAHSDEVGAMVRARDRVWKSA